MPRRSAVSVDLNDSFLSSGLYSVADASRIISQALHSKVGSTNLRRWAHGRSTISRNYSSIIDVRGKVADADLFTFVQLIELLTIATLRLNGISSKIIRHAYREAEERFGPNPFATQRYSIDGAGIFLTDSNEVEELASGRVAFEKILKPLLRDIVLYADDRSQCIVPQVKHRTIVLNPERAFGAPINRSSGVPTYALYGMVKSGEQIDDVADWYRVSVDGVEDAVEYETGLPKVA